MDSMEQIYLEHAKTVYGFLLTRTGNPDLAEELTQETFYQAVKHVDRYEGKSSVSTWLCGIAKNLWYGYLKNRRTRPAYPRQRRYRWTLRRRSSFAVGRTFKSCG